MNLILPSQPVTMSSREIAELTGKQHQHVKRDIEKMLAVLEEDTSKFGHIYLDSMNREQTEYRLDRDLTENLLLGYSPILRRKVLQRMRDMEAALAEPRIPTTAEGFAHAFTMLADAERREREQNIRLSLIDDRLDKVETAQTVLTTRPSASESIVHIRKRVGKEFGLSAAVVDAVMRQSPYAPKPAGMVRNEHVDADGSSYAVFWKKDVTATFRRFVEECASVTPTMCTHPFVEGRFKLVRRE